MGRLASSGVTGACAAMLALACMAPPAPASASVDPPRAVAAPDTLGAAVTGLVRVSGFRGGEGLPGVIIELRQDGRLHRAFTDAKGRYTIGGLRPGRARLHVFHIAALPVELEVSLPERGVVSLDLALERRILALPPVQVQATLPDLDEVAPTSPFREGSVRTGRLHIPALASTSGFLESGLSSSARTPPGEEPGDAGHVLFMRGSTVDSRQVRLDGAPILTPFHLAGLVPSFDTRLLGDARLHLGGAPAQYDGGLAYILDVETRDPRRDRVRGEAAVDPVAARAVLEVPLGARAGFLGAVRGVHGFGVSGTFPYDYGDALARLSLEPAPDHRIGLTVFRNREGVQLGTIGEAGFGRARRDDLASWGNRAISGRWSWRAPGEEARVRGWELLASHSHYVASLPLAWPDPLVAGTTASRSRIEATLTGRGFRAGGSMERQHYGWSLEALGPGLQTQAQPGEAERSGDRAGVFVEAERAPSTQVLVRGGLRVDAFGVDRSVRIAPRASVRLHLSDEAFLTLSAGRFHEVFPVSSIASEGGVLAEARVFLAPELAVASANHAVLALDQALTPDIRLEVSGFLKRFEGLDPSRGSRSTHASGTDLRVTREGDGMEGWLGYALSWVWSSTGGPAGGQPSPTRDFAGRHLLSAGARVTLAPGLEVAATLGYGAGLPLQAIPLASDVPNVGTGPVIPALRESDTTSRFANASAANPLEVAAEDEFLRLDLELSWGLNPRIGGRDTELRPYLRVLNALDQRDALFHYFDRWRDEELRPVATRPFLPLLGVEWRF